MQEDVTRMSARIPTHEMLKEMSKYVKIKDITSFCLNP